MKTQSAKAKGRELQKYVAKEIRKKFSLPEEDVVSRPMGSGGEDVMMSKDAKSKFPLSIECKNTKRFPSSAGLDQAVGNAKGMHGCVVWKPHRKGLEDSIIYFNFHDFLDLWKEYNDKE